MSQLLLSRSTYRQNFSRSSFSSSRIRKNSFHSQNRIRFEIKPFAFMGGLFLIAVCMSLVQLTQFNKVATKGYELKRLEADRQQLMSEYEIRNMDLAKIKALNTIVKSNKVATMRQAHDPTFMRGNTAVADAK